MGTSTSFRSPPRPRWSAFLAALLSGAPIERTRSELFNAGEDWQRALASPGIASYAKGLHALYDELPTRLAENVPPEVSIGGIIAKARHESLNVGFSPASSLADRAFARVLISRTGGLAEVGLAAPNAMAARWVASRGDHPEELVAQFLGEVLGQFARHVTDREAGRLISSNRGAQESARLSDALADRAFEIGTAAGRRAMASGVQVDAAWDGLVADAFSVGRELPRGSR